MFERYTDRARRAVALADQEAERLGHDTADIGHLLLGLIAEGGGVAYVALGELGVSLALAREAVLRQRPRGTSAAGSAREFTPGLKKALELATRESLTLGNNFVATEHLLLALLRQEGPAAEALRILVGDSGPGALAMVRQEVLRILQGHAEAGRREALARRAPRPGPRTDPESGYQVITIGGETVAIVPVGDLRRLLAAAGQAAAGGS